MARFLQLSLLLLALGVFWLTGCGSKLTPEQGSGVVGTQERTLESFSAIQVSGIGNVDIRFGKTDSCSVQTDDNLLDLYETRVEDSTLFLSAKSLISPKSGMRISIKTSNPVEQLTLDGACEVRFVDFAGSDLTVVATGANKFSATGRVDRLSFDASGNVEAELFDLESSEVTLKAIGASRINVYAEDKLQVKASGAAVIVYDGNPTLNEDLAGVSRLEQRD